MPKGGTHDSEGDLADPGTGPLRGRVIRAVMAWGPAALWAAVLFLLSELQPDPGSAWSLIPDKLAHLALYLVLGAALAWGWREGGEKTPPWLLVLAGAGYGALDEWHQSFVPGRNPSLGDLAADGAGVFLGFALLAYLTSHRPERRPDNPT